MQSRRENIRVFTIAQKPTFQKVRILTVARPVEPSLFEPAKPASQLARNPPWARNDKKSNSHIRKMEFLVSEMKGLQNWIFGGPASQSAKLASQASRPDTHFSKSTYFNSRAPRGTEPMHQIVQFPFDLGHICILDVKMYVFSQSPRNPLFKK